MIGTRGPLVEASLPGLAIGAGARILARTGRVIPARVTAIGTGTVALAPFGGIDGVAAGDRVIGDPSALRWRLGVGALGRALDALGTPLDGGPPLAGRAMAPRGESPPPADRRAIAARFVTGVRAIDGLFGFGRGARIGLFGPPGCGKSSLLETIVRGSSADVNVIGLIGERGREAQRWLSTLDARTTVVCATGDRSPAERVRAAELAVAQAEALRRRGLDVLLVIDSLARIAAAARDLALAAGEPVGRGGYPPSVFGVLANLLERAGAFAGGSITLVATVLSDGPDPRDPVSEAARAMLDGHIVLSERLAGRGWFPAIDVPASASRTLADVAGLDEIAQARRVREAIALLAQTQDARALGLDPGAGDATIRSAVAAEPAVATFLRQTEPCGLALTLAELGMLADGLSDGYPR